MKHLITHFRQQADRHRTLLARWIRYAEAEKIQPDTDYIAYGGPELLDSLVEALKDAADPDQPLIRDLESRARKQRHQDALRLQSQRRAASSFPREVREAYAALELALGADPESVREAWRKLMQRYHPDRFSTTPEKVDTARQITSGLNHAYDVIMTYWEPPRTQD
jgi:hypothetical protein